MKEKVYVIYRATCKSNGKVYIGFSADVVTRKRQHKKAALDGKDQVFYRAIRAHGWEDFEWDILFESLDREYVLNEMEPHFIELFESRNPKKGYNMTPGGEGNIDQSPEMRKKISEATKAAMARPEIKEATSQAQKKRFEENPESHGMKGKTHSEESKQKMSETTTNMSQETKDKIGVAVKKLMQDPDYKVRVISHLLNPSEETRAKMSLSKQGKPSWNKGKKWTESQINNMGRVKIHIFIDPKGKEIKIQNLAKFSRENGLNASLMSAVSTGNRQHHRGYTKVPS